MRKPTYTIQEVAALVQLSDQTIRDWVRQGRIVAVRPGGMRAYRIPLAEVVRLLGEFLIDESVLDRGGTIDRQQRKRGQAAIVSATA